MTQSDWKLHFKDQLAHVQDVQKLDLSQALSEGHLSYREYATWACNAYQIPWLRDDFFAQNKISSELLAKVKSACPWGETLVPLMEWNQIIFVGCLELPTQLPPGFQAVIANPRHLRKLWDAYHQESVSENLFDEHTRIPSKTIVAKVVSQLDGLESVKIPPSTPNAASDELILQDDVESAETPASENSLEEDKENELLELDLDASPTKLFQISKDEKASPVLSEPILTKVIETPSSADVAPEINPSNKLSSQSPSEELSLMEQEEGKTISPIEPHVTAAATVISSADSSLLYPLIRSTKKSQADLYSLLTELQLPVLTDYQKVFVLVISSDQTQAAVLNLEKQTIITENPIDLLAPSSFKLAASTLKPYHGYLNMNPLMEKFFVDYNEGSIPDTLTIAPVTHSAVSWALVVALGSTDAANSTSLELVENFAKSTEDFLNSTLANAA